METIKIVMASPSDLKSEREYITKIIQNKDSRYKRFGVTLDLRKWEDTLPEFNENGAQGVIDDDLGINEADIFICLFWKRFGTVIEQFGETGTQHELKVTMESKSKRGKPQISLLLKKVAPEEKNAEYESLNNYLESLSNKGLFQTFDDIKSLGIIIENILDTALATALRRKGNENTQSNCIECSDINTFLNNIQSGARLILHDNVYEMEKVEVANNHVLVEPVFDGSQVVIDGVSNVVIIGEHSKILASSRYANAITFRNCHNLKISGLIMGHIPHRGSCIGSAIGFENCYDITISTSDLFGCGAYGAVIRESERIVFNGCEIYECTDGAMLVLESNIQIKNSIIYDCNVIGGLFYFDASNVSMSNILIKNNTTPNNVFEFSDMSILDFEGVMIANTKCKGTGVDDPGVYIYNNSAF